MLTKPQYAALKAYINARPPLVALTVTNDWQAIADTLNAQVAPEFWVWKTSCSVDDIFDAINWANLTPVDAADLTTAWGNRALACQGKQFNIQTMLSGRDSINATKASTRNGLQDALTGVPSGVGGAAVAAGWANVRNVLKRTASVIESIYAVGVGTSANPATPVAQGEISPNGARTAYLEG